MVAAGADSVKGVLQYDIKSQHQVDKMLYFYNILLTCVHLWYKIILGRNGGMIMNEMLGSRIKELRNAKILLKNRLLTGLESADRNM